MKITLDINKFQEIIKKGYSLDLCFMLFCFVEQIGLGDSAKLSALKQTLCRKGLITENGEKLTTLGEELLKYIPVEREENDTGEGEFIPFVKNKTKCEDFETWWKVFPGSDTFTYKGREFCGCRTLRVNREECRIKFDKILLEGEYTANDLIQALSLDIFRKKEQSVRNGENKLTYMKASLTYLNQRAYEPLIEDIKNGAKIDKQTDIYYGING